MNEKTKKIIVLVFTAIISLAVSIAACLLEVPVDDLIPSQLIPPSPPAQSCYVQIENSDFGFVDYNIPSTNIRLT